MPPELAQAHDALDHAVDALYGSRKRFIGEADRLATLLECYQFLTTGDQTDA
jgi:hypothetical protein